MTEIPKQKLTVAEQPNSEGRKDVQAMKKDAVRAKYEDVSWKYASPERAATFRKTFPQTTASNAAIEKAAYSVYWNKENGFTDLDAAWNDPKFVQLMSEQLDRAENEKASPQDSLRGTMAAALDFVASGNDAVAKQYKFLNKNDLHTATAGNGTKYEFGIVPPKSEGDSYDVYVMGGGGKHESLRTKELPTSQEIATYMRRVLEAKTK